MALDKVKSVSYSLFSVVLAQIALQTESPDNVLPSCFVLGSSSKPSCFVLGSSSKQEKKTKRRMGHCRLFSSSSTARSEFSADWMRYAGIAFQQCDSIAH
jgi:hypothetical protein